MVQRDITGKLHMQFYCCSMFNIIHLKNFLKPRSNVILPHNKTSCNITAVMHLLYHAEFDHQSSFLLERCCCYHICTGECNRGTGQIID